MSTLPAARVAVIGSRYGYADTTEPEKRAKRTALRSRVEEAVSAYVRALPLECMLVTGGATGVDHWASLANRSARPVLELRPGWRSEEAGEAGFARNTWIVEMSTAVVAFWDGKSNGTADTVRKAIAAGKLAAVFVYNLECLEGKRIS